MPVIATIFVFAIFIYPIDMMRLSAADSLMEAGLILLHNKKDYEEAKEVFKKIMSIKAIDKKLYEAAKRSYEYSLLPRQHYKQRVLQEKQLLRNDGNLLMGRIRLPFRPQFISPVGNDGFVITAITGEMARVGMDGQVLWIHRHTIGRLKPLSNGKYICFIEAGNQLAIIDAVAGMPKWRIRFYSPIADIAIDNDGSAVYVLALNGKLSRYSLLGGELVWSTQVIASRDTRIAATGAGGVVLLENNRNHYCYSKDNGEIMWSMLTQQVIASFIAASRLIVSGKRIVYSISLQDGKENWRKTVSDGIEVCDQTSNSNLVIYDSGGRLLTIDIASGKEVSAVSLNDAGKFYISFEGLAVFIDHRGVVRAYDFKGKNLWQYGLGDDEIDLVLRVGTKLVISTEKSGLFILNSEMRLPVDARVAAALDKASHLSENGMIELASKQYQDILLELEPGNSVAAVKNAFLIQYSGDTLAALANWSGTLAFAEVKYLSSSGALDKIREFIGAEWCGFEPNATKFSPMKVIDGIIAVPCKGYIRHFGTMRGEDYVDAKFLRGQQVIRVEQNGYNGLIAQTESAIYSLTRKSGTVGWKFPLQGGVTSFFSEGGIVWIGTWENGIYVVDSDKGKFMSRMLVGNKGIFVNSFGSWIVGIGLNGTINGFNNGRFIYLTRSRDPFLALSSQLNNEMIFSLATSGGAIEGWSVQNGTNIWRNEFGAQAIGLAATRNGFAAILADGRVVLQNGSDGRIIWTVSSIRGQLPEFVVSIGQFVVTAGDDLVVFRRLIDGATHSTVRLPGRVAALTANDSYVFVRLENGLVCSLRR